MTEFEIAVVAQLTRIADALEQRDPTKVYWTNEALSLLHADLSRRATYAAAGGGVSAAAAELAALESIFPELAPRKGIPG